MRASTGAYLAALLAAAPVASSAQTRTAPESRAAVTLSFAPVVKEVAPAVVNVYGARVEQRARANPLTEDELFRRFFGGGEGGLPEGRAQRSLGSGVLVDPSGLVVTNHHVIEGMTEVRVALADRREFEAEIVLRDPRTDLAVLKIKAEERFPALPLGDSEALEVGDLVLAIGNPFGVGQTVTSGIVSALARTHVGVSNYQFFIQTDAAINPGNSGGGLVDTQGRLVGINTAIYSRSGGSIGIGFAIPSTMVRVVVESARGGGRSVRRPYFGATVQAVSGELAPTVGLDRPSGVLVARVLDRGPAADAGLKRGDVILAVDGQVVDDPDAFGFRFATKPLGGTVTLTVHRAGKRLALPVGLALAPETRPREPVTLAGRSPLAGVKALNLSPAVADELSLDPTSEGVVVAEIEERSQAARLGFQRGDVLLAVNGQKVEDTRALERAMRERAGLWRITLERGGQVLTSAFGG